MTNVNTLDRTPREWGVGFAADLDRGDTDGFVSDDPSKPDDFMSVWGWWVSKESEAFEELRNPLAALYAEADKLEMIAGERGIPMLWVQAGRALQSVGLGYVRAFPTWLLAEFYPANP